MRKSLKTKLRNKELILGSWVTIGHTSVVEIMAKAGFDFLTVDMEHSSITLYQAAQLVQVIDLAGVSPLVRVGENNANLIKRVMDAGAHGVIVPLVNSKEDAQKAVESVKYPPIGKRGVGLTRAQGYGTNFENYKKWVEDESVVIVQIEHIEAVNNLEEIISVDGVDGFIIGPYDLSGSLGRPGEFDHPSVIEALEKVKRVALNSKISSGFHVVTSDESKVIEKLDEGYNFLAYSLDILFLGDRCREGVSKIKRMQSLDKE
jgi:2-dehydro-3-deoxyglucarate aldolase